MNDRFKFRTPIYGPDREFKDLIYWNAEDVRRVKNGRLCACCLSRAIKLKARKGQGQV